MSNVILALDQGTSSTRAFLYHMDGQPVGYAQKALALATPQAGWVEQDPHSILKDSLEVIGKVLSQHPSCQPVCLGITNQRETTLVWDKKSKEPIYPAIVWQDRRTQKECEQLKARGHEATIQKKTGLVIDPYFSALKIAWILDNVPGARQKALRGDLLFGTVDCYLLWHLTHGQVHATDMTNASRTMLFNIETFSWDQELCALFDIPMHMLPEVKPSDSTFGTVDGQYFNQTIPITGMIGDQQSASLGQGCIQAGDLKSTYGTGCFMLLNVGPTMCLSKHKLLTTIGLSVGETIHYALEGALFTAGAMKQWLRDNLKILPDVKASDKLAQEVAYHHDVMVIPALTGLGAPVWDPKAKAAIFGLSLDTDYSHVIAACHEAISFQTRLLIETFAKDAQHPIEQCFIDGGMSENNWFCQTLSHTLNCAIIRPKNVETTAWGAAFLAGVGLGLFALEDVHIFKAIDRRFEPDHHHEHLTEKYKLWLEKLALISPFQYVEPVSNLSTRIV